MSSHQVSLLEIVWSSLCVFCYTCLNRKHQAASNMETLHTPAQKKSALLWQLAGIFLKIGAITFGGPMALIAVMEQEFVRKRQWLTQDQYMDFIAATNLVPGPNACEMAGLVGFHRARYAGLVVAELSFIIPSLVPSLILAVIYMRFGTLPQVSAIFYGINPVIVALILHAIFRLGKNTFTNYAAVVIFGLAALGTILGASQVMIILAAGILGMLLYALPLLGGRKAGLLAFIPFMNFTPFLKLVSDSTENILLKLFLLFLKTGSLIFGSGLVLFAFIQEDIVEKLGWLSQQQLIDAIAVGQMTPGPVSSSAAFIGYVVAGWPGAILSTIGIFLPSFIIVAVIAPIIPKLQRSQLLKAFLKGVNAAVLALMLSVALTIAKSSVVDIWTLLVLIFSLICLKLWKVDSFWLVFGGAAIGVIQFLLR